MNNTACPEGYSNADELALREINDCSVYEKYVQYVFIFNATAAYALALFSFKKAYPLVEKRQLYLAYIPHADLVCWGVYGLSNGVMFTFKAIKLINKVSEANPIELMYHSIAPLAFSPAVWLFLYTLMAAACSAEIGPHAAVLRERFWRISKFFMNTTVLVLQLPYWLAIAYPSRIQAASILIVLVILGIGISVGCTTAVSAYALSTVLARVVRQETQSGSGGTSESTGSNKKTRLQNLELARSHLHVGALIICIGICLPACLLCLLTLLNDMAARHSFFFYCTCHGMGGTLGLAAVVAVLKTAPPNKHTHPGMFIGGRRGYHTNAVATTVTVQSQTSHFSPQHHEVSTTSSKEEELGPSPDHHEGMMIRTTDRAPPRRVLGGGWRVLPLSS